MPVFRSSAFVSSASVQPGGEIGARSGYTRCMIILGVILLILGLLLGVAILWVIGLVLIAVGAVLWIAGSAGHEIGGRRHYW